MNSKLIESERDNNIYCNVNKTKFPINDNKKLVVTSNKLEHENLAV